MNKAEMLLAAKMLEMASEEFANHGCGDFDLSKHMADDEIVDFTIEHETWNVGGKYEDIDLDIREEIESRNMDRLKWTQDWVIMSALANKLEKEAEE